MKNGMQSWLNILRRIKDSGRAKKGLQVKNGMQSWLNILRRIKDSGRAKKGRRFRIVGSEKFEENCCLGRMMFSE